MRVEGLEPPRIKAPDPKSGASTNSATPAFCLFGIVWFLITPAWSINSPDLTYFELLVFTFCSQEVEVRYLLALIQLSGDENP